MTSDSAPSIYAPARWGLSADAIADLGNRLYRTWERFRSCFKTKTQDSSAHALTYLRGLLTLETKRNYANIARRVKGLWDDGQDLQNFMSDSPWQARAVFDQIQRELQARPTLRGGMLTLDESGDERAGDQSAGAARQYLGRFGKVDLGQVGVALGYYYQGTWALVDACLFLPQVWFDPAHADLRRRLHIPADLQFASKPQLGLALIRQAQANGLEFEVVGCDSLYGRSGQFRADVDAAGLLYMADVPANTQVYLQEPQVGIPPTPPGKAGRPFSQWQVLNDVRPVCVRELPQQPAWRLQPLPLRQCERGLLTYDCAAQRIWTISEAGQVRGEWLFIRREADDTHSYSLSNAPAETPLARLALWRCHRYFAERIFQDAKSEGGWDELVARKYRAWVHHAALDALALWFMAETKLDWAQAQPRDPQLTQELQVEQLPALSLANVRELLRAVMPLPTLSPAEATEWVIHHLVNRAASTRSRLKAQQLPASTRAKKRAPG
ncbi:MAG: IS701 family transposase [Planctomycetota bacterium]